MPPPVIIMRDRSQGILAALRELVKEEVLVGIPEEKSGRNSSGVTNAALGYIHEFGAPGANIPARPHLIPGVRKAEAPATSHLRVACLAALDGHPDAAHAALVRAGIVAVSFVRREITTGNFVPLAPGTVAGRKYGRETASRREAEDQYAKLIREGATPAAAQESAGIRPLINSAQLLHAYTSVVRKVR